MFTSPKKVSGDRGVSLSYFPANLGAEDVGAASARLCGRTKPAVPFAALSLPLLSYGAIGAPFPTGAALTSVSGPLPVVSWHEP